MAIREEVESLVDLSTLSIMEQTCKGPHRGWAKNARIQSDYLSSTGSVLDRNKRIQDWNDANERTDGVIQPSYMEEPPMKRHTYKHLSRSELRSTPVDPRSLTVDTPRSNTTKYSLEVYVCCLPEVRLQSEAEPVLLSKTILDDLIFSLEKSKYSRENAYYSAREKMIQKIIGKEKFRWDYDCIHGEYRQKYQKWRAKVHVFCPPSLECIKFALALAPPDPIHNKTEFDIVIHLDDRLLDEGISMADGKESLSQLDTIVCSYADLGNPVNDFHSLMAHERKCQYVATRFDQVFMDQRVTAMTTQGYRRDAVDAFEYFGEVAQDEQHVSTIIMAGPQVCRSMTSTAPLVPPDFPVQPGQIYNLVELADVDDKSRFRWKTKHFCRIVSPYER